jgi:ABC-type sugar transport system permease subunit
MTITANTSPATSNPPAPLRGAGKTTRRASREIGLMLAPGITVLIIFFGLPVIDLLQTSLSQWSGIGQRRFTGVDNYLQLLTDNSFLNSLLNSILLGIGTAAGIGIIATILAALISGKIYGGAFYRIVWFLPAIAPPSAVAVFWSLSVQPRSGAVNAFLGAIGLGDTHAWLSDSSTAMYVIIAVAIWQGAGFAFLVILGAMEEVPVSTYEAASLDGASPVRSFFLITLPLVRPVLSMIILLEAIWAFNGFTLVWGMTQGGPGDVTTILPVQVYKEAFRFGDFGMAAAISVIGGVILLAVGFAGQWLGSRKAADD